MSDLMDFNLEALHYQMYYILNRKIKNIIQRINGKYCRDQTEGIKKRTDWIRGGLWSNYLQLHLIISKPNATGVLEKPNRKIQADRGGDGTGPWSQNTAQTSGETDWNGLVLLRARLNAGSRREDKKILRRTPMINAARIKLSHETSTCSRRYL